MKEGTEDMNDIWSILEIKATDDKKAIRKAFAAQSRLHHPEEEPEYFAALNQAYKAALDYAAGGENAAVPTDNSADDSRSALDKNSTFVPVGFNGKTGKEKKEILPEKEQGKAEDQIQNNDETNETPEENEDKKQDEGTLSLLDRLDQAAEQAVKRSRETGALRDFIALFENPKQAKQADTWKRFFLSEAFLQEQFSEEFAKGLLAYLAEQTLCPGDNLPRYLLQELAVAYAFIPHFAGEEYFDGLKYPKEWYKVSVENTFPARRVAAEIFNRQGRDCDLKSMTNHILRQPGNKVRHNAFSDYLTMKEMNRDGRLTDREKETWQHVLGACQPYYLYERNGKKPGTADYESRSESVVKLYVQWLKDEQPPREVLLFLYKKLNFKDLERSSTRGLYSALKAEVLRLCPQAEETLFGEDGKEQRIVKLYKTYASIINANQNNYDKFIYEETPEIRDRINAFFALPDWEQLKGEKALFERIYSTSKRIVMPRTAAEILVRHLTEGDFPEPERTELIESLLRSLSTERMCRELDYRCEITLSSRDLGDIGDNPDFWQYFLMRGFGFRHGNVRGNWEEDFVYVMDGQCYLPAYINYIYAPSREWQRCFTGFDPEKEETGEPVSLVCPMPGNRSLKVEFHYRYCLYFVDGIQADGPVLTFSQLQEYAENLNKPQEFFFLLAVTAIEDSNRGAARKLIEDWLKRIPLHSFLVPTVARLLAADNDRIPVTVTDSWDLSGGEGHGSGKNIECSALSDGETREKMPTENTAPETGTQDQGAEEEREVDKSTEDMSAEDKSEEDKSTEDMSAEDKSEEDKNTEDKVEAVLYSEQERFCFRAVVSKKGFSIWRQMDYGWQDIIFRRGELGWRKWEEYTWEEYRLYCETQKQIGENASESKVPENDIPTDSGDVMPLPISCSALSTDSLQGRKAAAINALQNLRQPKPKVRASYSLEGMDVAQKAAKILEEMGCIENMEGYCILRYGAKKEKRHDRIFYGVRAPFGFDLKAHSPVYVRSRDFLMSSSDTKIKEPKILVGRFGWGFKYSPRSDYGPMYVYQGESGKFYAYGAIRMHRADSLEQLLEDFFRQEWEGVTEVETYEGCLTVSRLDHRLEYCYTEEDMYGSMGSLTDTAADKFTLFGGYGMWKAFVWWMDELLNPGLPAWVNLIVVGFDWEKGGALTFTGVHEEEKEAHRAELWEKADMDFEEWADDEDWEDEDDWVDEDESESDEQDMKEPEVDELYKNESEEEPHENETDMNEPDMDESDMDAPYINEPAEQNSGLQNNVYLPQAPLLIWARGMDRMERGEFLTNAMQWYVDCGRFAEKTGGRNIKIAVNRF